MVLANQDSSNLTRVRQARALYAYNQANSAAVTAGTSVRREQPNTQLLSVTTLRRQGGCYCPTGNITNLNNPGPCGCSR